ncbi:MAG: hypothetical protein VX874_07880 [Pseudomonadota bacterium]|nr:hypothetical protein [Pseudomonadota bacterium]
MRLRTVILGGAGALILIALGVTGALMFMGRTLCTVSAEVARIASPDGRVDAVLYEYNCGPSTPFATHVSLLKPGQPATKAGNVFAATMGTSDGVSAPWGGPWAELRWEGARQLVVLYDRGAQVVRNETSRRRVAVEYDPIER